MDDYLFFLLQSGGSDSPGRRGMTKGYVAPRQAWRRFARPEFGRDRGQRLPAAPPRRALNPPRRRPRRRPGLNIEGGRTASSTGRGNEECAARPTRPSESRVWVAWTRGRSRGARPRLKINLVSYLGVARARAARALTIARSTTEDMITTRGWTCANLVALYRLNSTKFSHSTARP